VTSGATSRSLSDAPWLSAGALPRLLGVLDGNGEEARVVGGAVRNALLGIAIHEIDVATTAVPDEVVKRVTAAGFKPVPTGIEHGTVTVVIDKHPFEVTTLRQDVETYGRHAKVAFGRDWKTDAERRDFTINALSATRDGAVYDYVGGLDDLAARRVRFIGDPGKRIAEDYLRILRFFRFHAAYGTSDHPDAEGIAACIAGREGLGQLSRERLRMELMKLVVGTHAVPTLARALLYRLGLEHFTDHALLGWARSQAAASDAAWHALATLPQRWSAPVFPLKAADFIKRGVEKGPALGAVMRRAEEAWIKAGFPVDAVAIDSIATATVTQASEQK